jgi:hypothetical protein
VPVDGSTACGSPLLRLNRNADVLVGGRAEGRDAAPPARPDLVVDLGEREVLLPQPVESQAWHS